MIATLIPLDGSPPIHIVRDVTVVGRKQGLCDLIFDHESISKMHCVIARTDGLLFFRDLGSTNGTRVNGQRVVRGALLPNDELAFAALKFRVHLGPGEIEARPEERTEMFDVFPKQSVEGPFGHDKTRDSSRDHEILADSRVGD
ncbi:FHA domain protein [Caulifigura coniformis]|uniref:FHA domain protein n=1 Tax=Caulifigura coniformis TaxID=2527983 RepID=A0A517SAN4_9PLAN|nr:FHA domain-containing protein [Caulifigura coniformis]QDT53194.1 FHA domain protein [Caulifigura coniformis]